MDNKIFYTWELNEDELNLIWHAIIEKRDDLHRKATKEATPEGRQVYKSIAEKYIGLQEQIGRMKKEYYYGG